MHQSSSRIRNLSLVLAGMLIACFVLRYVGSEHPGYFWDYGVFFHKYQELGNKLSEAPIATIQNILLRIRSEEYNSSSVIPLMPFYFLMGPDRAAYIFGIVFMLLMPACYVSYRLSVLASDDDPPQLASIAACFFVFLFPAYWQSVLRGFPDVIGLIPLGLASILLLKTQFLQKNLDNRELFLQQAILFGLLLWLTFLFRRWYAYSVVSLFCCAYIVALWQTWRTNRSFLGLVRASIPFVVTGLTITILLLSFQFDLAVKVANADYFSMYSAYKTTFGRQIDYYYANLGPVFVIFFLVGFALSLWHGRLKPLFFAAVSIISGLLIGTLQFSDIHHQLPVVAFLMPTAALPIFLAFKHFSQRTQLLALAALATTSVAIFLTSFSASFPQLAPVFAAISPRIPRPPIHYKQYSEYQRLIAFLHKTLTPDRQAAIFASNVVLCNSLLFEFDRSLGPLMVWTGDVDERDRLPLNSIEAEFAVVADPLPLHMPPTSQRVVTVPAGMVLSGTGIGTGYKRIAGPFELEKGHKAYVYQRTRPVSSDDMRIIGATLKSYHPDWRWDGANWTRRPAG